MMADCSTTRSTTDQSRHPHHVACVQRDERQFPRQRAGDEQHLRQLDELRGRAGRTGWDQCLDWHQRLQPAPVQPVLQQRATTPVTPTSTPPTSSGTRTSATSGATSRPIFGDPKFIDPANGNFGLQPTSAAIDAARSEIGPLPAGDTIFPTVNQLAQQHRRHPHRPDDACPSARARAAATSSAASASSHDPRKIVTLPGSGSFSFQDEWVPALSDRSQRPYRPVIRRRERINYAPISGQRDSSASSASMLRACPTPASAGARSWTSAPTST